MPNSTSTRGYVYLISYVEIPGKYKIGCTTDLARRLDNLSCACPFDVVLVHSIECDDSQQLERQLHKRFWGKRVRREWFALNETDVEYIRSLPGGEIPFDIPESDPKGLPNHPLSSSDTDGKSYKDLGDWLGMFALFCTVCHREPAHAFRKAIEMYADYGLTNDIACQTMLKIAREETKCDPEDLRAMFDPRYTLTYGIVRYNERGKSQKWIEMRILETALYMALLGSRWTENLGDLSAIEVAIMPQLKARLCEQFAIPIVTQGDWRDELSIRELGVLALIEKQMASEGV